MHSFPCRSKPPSQANPLYQQILKSWRQRKPLPTSGEVTRYDPYVAMGVSEQRTVSHVIKLARRDERRRRMEAKKPKLSIDESFESGLRLFSPTSRDSRLPGIRSHKRWQSVLL